MRTMPAFGFISGMATTVGFLPHIIALVFIIITKNAVDATPVLVSFTIGTRFLGDWLFWSRMFPKEMDSGKNLENWRSSVKNLLFSQPTAIRSLIDMIIDTGVDVFLIYTALKMSVPPVWIFLVFASCQAVAAPIQGIILTRLNKRNIRLFSMIVTAMATMAALETNGMTGLDTYVPIFGLSHFAVHVKMLIVLGVKCLLTGTTIIAKATIAEVIKLETAKKLSKP